MDLRTWVSGDLASLRRRLDGGVLNVIPHSRRAERVDGGGIAPSYVLWHLTRHHDVAVNRVLRGVGEVVEGWTDRLGVATDLWRGLAEGEDGDLVGQLDPAALDAYVLAVLDTSAAWVAEVDPDDLAARLDARPDTTAALGALGVPEDRFDWLYSMWSGQPGSFFLSWEAVGHGYNHLGELISIRNRMGLSPF